MRTLFLLAALTWIGCGEDGGSTMKPGEDCTGCHHDFTIAGTVFPSAQAQASAGLAGVTVTVVDSAQNTVTLTSNSAGNFYSQAAVTWPATITLALGARTATMASATAGGCASCHSPAAQGRVYLP